MDPMMPREADHSADHPRSNDTVERAALFGRDHTGSGAMAMLGVGDRTAIGIARGWRPKPYAYVDPNEDAVGAVADDRVQLLVVADGHSGDRASHTALETVLAVLGSTLPPADLDDDDLVAMLVQGG